MPTKLLIYDDGCAYCRGFVRLVGLLDRDKKISAIPFDVPDSQALLHAQFDTRYGFAMYLFEHEHVSWGQEAARRVIEIISLPRWMAKLAFYVYPFLVEVVSKLTRRTRPVCGPECIGLEPESKAQHSMELHKGALQELERLLSRGAACRPRSTQPL